MTRISKLDRRIVERTRAEILQWLYILKKMKRADLQRNIGIKSGTLSSHLDELEKGGYVKVVEGSPKVVKITQKGKKAFEELQKALIQDIQKSPKSKK